jgi:hypothetical protein
MFTYPYEDDNILVGIFYLKGINMMIDGLTDIHIPHRRDPQEQRERNARRQELTRQKRIEEDTRRCMECKHFFYGHPSSPYGTTNMIPWTKHSTLKNLVWDEYGGPSGEAYQKGCCRFNPEPTDKHTGDTCGRFTHDETKIYKMIEFYGECTHDLLHEVFPERDWYLQDFPSQVPPEDTEENVETEPAFQNEEMFEVE